MKHKRLVCFISMLFISMMMLSGCMKTEPPKTYEGTVIDSNETNTFRENFIIETDEGERLNVLVSENDFGTNDDCRIVIVGDRIICDLTPASGGRNQYLASRFEKVN